MNSTAPAETPSSLKKQYPPISLYWPGHLIAAAVIGLTMVVAWRIYPTLPDPFPTHWNAEGEVDGWTSKSMVHFFGLLAMMPGMMFVSLLFAAGLVYFQSSTLFGPGGARSTQHAIRQWHLLRLMRKPLAQLNAWLTTAIAVMMIVQYSPPSWGAIRDVATSPAFILVTIVVIVLPVIFFV